MYVSVSLPPTPMDRLHFTLCLSFQFLWFDLLTSFHWALQIQHYLLPFLPSASHHPPTGLALSISFLFLFHISVLWVCSKSLPCSRYCSAAHGILRRKVQVLCLHSVQTPSWASYLLLSIIRAAAYNCVKSSRNTFCSFLVLLLTGGAKTVTVLRTCILIWCSGDMLGVSWKKSGWRTSAALPPSWALS